MNLGFKNMHNGGCYSMCNLKWTYLDKMMILRLPLCSWILEYLGKPSISMMVNPQMIAEAPFDIYI